MSRMRLPKLSIDGAEIALARLWCTLEAEELPSPGIRAVFDGDRITLTLLFPDRRTHLFAKSLMASRREASTATGHAGAASDGF
jgi:hypothetical protein